jgi:hypothetical protein
MTVTNMFKPPDLNAMLFKDAQNYILMICNLHSISGTVVPNDIGCNTMCCWYNQFRPYHHYPSIPHFQMMPPALSRKRGANRVRFCQGAGVCRGISNSRSLAPLSNFSFLSSGERLIWGGAGRANHRSYPSGRPRGEVASPQGCTGSIFLPCFDHEGGRAT